MILVLLPLVLLAALPQTPEGQGGQGSYDNLYTWNNSYHSQYGQAFSDAGDVNGDGFDDLIVGASSYDDVGMNKIDIGQAFVYSGLDGTVLYQWEGTVDGEKFGHAAAGAGDLNADGFADFIVGAIGAGPGGRHKSGAVTAFSGVDGSILHQWTGFSGADAMGQSVAAAGDVNGDGYDDVIVGATRTDLGSLWDVGSAYVFSGLDGSLIYQWNGEGSTDLFGHSVSSAGDVNADGVADLIVGAYLANPGGKNNAGSAYVYSGADGSLLYQFVGESASHEFGSSVSSAGDVNGDGFDDLLVGAQDATAPGVPSFAGAAYVFSGADGTLLHRWFGDDLIGYFGCSVSDVGDMNSDGFADVMIGAYGAGRTFAGSAYIYSGKTGGLLYEWLGTFDSYLGICVSSAGDVNNDGSPDIIIGSTRAAFVFTFNPILRSSASTISASAGGTLQLDLDFPATASNLGYKVLASTSGMGPIDYGVGIPLGFDALFVATFSGNYPVPTTNAHGTLDADGDATASFTMPTGMPSSLIGNTFHLAAIASLPGLQIPAFSSMGVAITITP